MSRRAHHRNASRTLDKLLAMGAFPIVNENDTVATDEIRFGDNDRLAALVAHLVRADLRVLLSDVDGVYDGDPSRPGTSRLAEVRETPILAGVDMGSAGKAGVGTSGMVTKVEAARIAAAAGISVVLTSAVHAADALAGKDTGTYFHTTGKRCRRPAAVAPARLHPAGGARPRRRGGPRGRRGPQVAAAGRDRRRRGRVRRGRPGRVAGRCGARGGPGLVSFDASELPRLLGRSTRELARELDRRTNARSYTGTIW